MKVVYILILTTTFISCDTDDKIDFLTQENKKLREKIIHLQQHQNPCKFYAFPTMEKYLFKQGEEGNYTISLALFNEIEKTTVILSNPETNKYQDTFIMNNGYSLELPFDTRKSGDHIVSGKVQCLMRGIKQEEYFEIKYIVE